MVDIIKQDMTNIWAVGGDVVAPDVSKQRAGWAVEAVPRQWWNWLENRQDTNIAYMLQKGVPEWDAFTEYLTNKSYVQRNNIVYKCILGGINKDPTSNPLSWVKAFPESTVYLETIKGLAVTANTFAYMNASGIAASTAISAFGRGAVNVADAPAFRTYISAQLANNNLTALSGVTAATNSLPYFTGTTTMGTTTLTAFARTLLDDVDAATARATLGVDSAGDTSAALAAGLATKQPLNATLTSLAAVATATNKLPYFSGTNTVATTDITAFSRTLLAAANAATVRTALGLGTSATYDVNTSIYGDTSASSVLGPVLRSGSFGLGSTDLLDMPSGTDWNTINATGFYQMTSGPNGPGASGQMLVMTNASNYMTQIMSPQDSTGRLLFRSSSNGVFSPWNTAWSSANLVKTTSPTDTTAGSMLQVGDFGLGNSGPSATTSLDALTAGGFYRASSTATGLPVANSMSIIQSQFNTGGALQIAGALTTGGGLYWRQQSGGTWGTWYQAAKVDYVDSAISTVNSAIDLKASLASPAFTGTPTAPTAATATNNTQVATTAFTKAALAAGNAATASKWATARSLTYTGDLTGSTSFDGSANVSVNVTLNTALVDQRIAAMVAGSIGSYALMVVGGNGGTEPGTTVSGSQLRYSAADANASASIPTGTWRLMGKIAAATGIGSGAVTLCLRVN